MKRPVIALACGLSAAIASEEPTVAFVELTAPPPPAVVENPKAEPAPSPRTTLWSIGEPTDQEQLYLELINRARANPGVEGVRLAAIAASDPAILQAINTYGVDLNMMKTEMTARGSAWPLAMNAKLLLSARGHSADMLANNFQGHTGTNGKSIDQRATAQGFTPSFIAENIYNASKSTEYGHAGFEIDWGAGPGGMQSPRGHRDITHGGYREVGIGIKDGTNGGTGPQVITQDFAIAAGPTTPFITGVAYYDVNGNNFYDSGEGIGGIQVTVSGAAYHGITAGSGGYAVPVPAGAAARTVTFSGNGFFYSTTAQVRSDNWSLKLDFKPAYTPPALNGSPAPVISIPNQYGLGVVTGADSHQWRYMRRTPAVTDGANDTTRVSSTIGSLLSSLRQEGSASYRLSNAAGRNESVTYLSNRVAGAAPAMTYYSRLAGLMSTQKTYVQVSTDDGLNWTTLPVTPAEANGQTSFTQRTVNLASVAGKEFKIRFYFAITGTSYSPSAEWNIDNISFTDTLDTTGAVTASVPASNAISFSPPSTGEWLLSARPSIAGRSLSYGPNLSVTAVPTPPPPTFANWAATQEGAAGLPAGTIASNGAADFNKDGVANLMAYALGLSATQYAGHQLPQAARAGSSLVLDYSRDTAKSDITLTPQISANFQTWYSPGQTGAPAGFTDTLMGTLGTAQSRRAALPITPGTRYFLRLKVTRP